MEEEEYEALVATCFHFPDISRDDPPVPRYLSISIEFPRISDISKISSFFEENVGGHEDEYAVEDHGEADPARELR